MNNRPGFPYLCRPDKSSCRGRFHAHRPSSETEDMSTARCSRRNLSRHAEECGRSPKVFEQRHSYRDCLIELLNKLGKLARKHLFRAASSTRALKNRENVEVVPIDC